MTKPLAFLRRIAHDARVLLPLLPGDPAGFYRRLAMSIENRREALRQAPDYETRIWDNVADELAAQSGVSAGDFLREAALHEIEQAVREGIAALPADALFSSKLNADFTLARMHYLACRALEPEIVVETGVAYGVSSALSCKRWPSTGRGCCTVLTCHPQSVTMPASTSAISFPQN